MSKAKNFFRASAEDFKKIPGSPVAYWVSSRAVDSFLNHKLATYGNTRQGFATGDNNRFLRFWHEVSHSMIAFNCSSGLESRSRDEKWFPCHKGGSFRKWYGNHEYLANWLHNGEEMSAFAGSVIRNPQYYFQKGLNWSSLSSGTFGMRMGPAGFLFESKGSMFFANSMQDLDCLLGVMNSKSVNYALKVLAPTLDFHEGPVSKTPIVTLTIERRRIVESNVDSLVATARVDWNTYETSWDFTVNPLVAERNNPVNPVDPFEKDGAASDRALPEIYAAVREKWAKDCEEMRRLEMENNRIFIEAYGLQDELTPEVPWQEITLTCNPFYRYGVKEVEKVSGGGDGAAGVCALPRVAELEERLKSDTVKELISYGVGCMMGRYSLAKPGLILADQGAQVSDRWIVVSGQRSGQGSVDSGQRSGQGGVDRVQCRDLLVLRETVVECVRKELQRIDCLAEGDGSRGRSVSTGEAASSGGAVCLVGSTATSGRIDSVEHRRGTGTEHDSRLSELSDNGSRVVLRDGNTVVDLCSPEVLDAIASGSGAELVRRGWKDAERVDWKAIHSSLATNHFSPDEDGIIPVLDDDCFADDIVTQFEKFLVAAFGTAQLGANRAFIEQALGKNLRSYFVKDFYADHLQRYQKRPIYWLFSSPKGTFNALVYLHRYQTNTAGQVLGYLRSFITKLQAKIEATDKTAADPSASQSFRTRAIKERTKLARQLKELEDYERDVLHPLSLQHVALDLDDGVKVNYLKLGAALKKIPGLEAKE